MGVAAAVVVLAVVAATGCTGGGGTTIAGRPSTAQRSAAGAVSASVPPTAPARGGRLRARVVGHLAQPVSRAVGVLAGRRVIVLGGLTTGDVTTDRVVAVDPESYHGVVDGSLREPVHDASGAWLSGHAFVFGGGAAAEVADVQSWTDGQSRIVGRLPQGRSDSASVTIGATAYVVGGFDGARMTRDIVATRDGRHVGVVGRLRVGVRYPAAAAFHGDVYVFGGQLATTVGTSTGAQSELVQRFGPGTRRTTVAGHLPRTLGHAMAFALGGQLYVAGGRHRTTATDRIWRVETGSARLRLVPAGRLPHPLSDAAVVRVGGEVLLVGGETTGPYAPQSTIVAVTPARAARLPPRR